jgi:hypothetical protein
MTLPDWNRVKMMTAGELEPLSANNPVIQTSLFSKIARKRCSEVRSEKIEIQSKSQ